MTGKNLIIVGSGGHSRVAIDIATQNKYNILGIIDINYKKNNTKNILGYQILGDIKSLENKKLKKSKIFIAIGDIKLRKKIYNSLKKNFQFINLIHKTAKISNYTKLGNNLLINTGAIINAEVIIDDNSIINSGSIIEHEVYIGKNVNINPNVAIGGRTTIKNNTYVGIGATIIDSINIGENVVIGAGSVVIKDIKKNLTSIGVPSRILKNEN